MRKDESFGIIPIRFVKGACYVLLVQDKKGGHWGFPKGHKEFGENPRQAAIRELKEETGIDQIEFIPHEETLEESYTFSKEETLIQKTVRYFIAKVLTEEVSIQQEEILAFQWVNIKEASSIITYPESQILCKRAAAILTDLYGHSI